MMKRLKTSALLLIGLIFISAGSTPAQSKCPDSLTEDAFHKCWIKEAKSGNKDLRNSYLGNADLQNVDLSNADLTNAQIVSANLSGANLSGANLTNANLAGTNFSGANFKGATLNKAGFGSANLSNADLSGAKMDGVSFLGGAKLAGAKIDLSTLQCQVATKGGDLNTEGSDGTVYGKIKNGTVVYKTGNDQGWDKGRIAVNELRDEELVDVGLVDGKYLTCNTPTKVTSDKTITCTVRTSGAKLNARSLAGKLLFQIENESEVYVFEQSKDGRAKVSVFNDDNEEYKGWVPRKYLSCDGE